MKLSQTTNPGGRVWQYSRTGLLLLSAVALPLNAAFELVNDFSAGLGDLAWSQTLEIGTGSIEVVADPVPVRNVNNQVVAIRAGILNTSSVIATLPIPQISDSSSGTVFLRFAIDTSESKTDVAITISPLESPSGHGNANVLLVSNPADQLRYRNGGAYETVLEERANLAWYKAWFVVDTDADRSSLYLQGPGSGTATLVADDFAFRKDTAGEDLITLMFIAYAGNSGEANLNGVVYVDDIFVDNQGENLGDPTDAALEARPGAGFLKTKTSITVDGAKDGVYTARGTAIERIGVGVNSPADLSAMMYGTWNDNGLYLLIEVTDDVFSSENEIANSYQDDSVELYFDPNLKRNGNLTANDAKIVVHPKPDGTAEVWATTWPNLSPTADFSGLQAAYVATSTGYAVEVFIPWAGLQINPTGDWDLGLGIQVNDNDGADLNDPPNGLSDREGYLIWGIGSDEFNFNTQNYGVVTLQAPKETLINRTSAVITTDGERDAAYNTSYINSTDGRWIGAGGHPADSSVIWRAVYDNDNLYLMFEITDSVIVNDSGTQSWQDDSLELFLDGNNSKGGPVDGYDDVKITFRPLADGGLDVIHTGGYPPPPAGTDFSGLEAMHQITETGWNLEVKIPLSIIKLDPVPGSAFGIDFALNDDDDGEVRDGMLIWSAGIELNNRTDVMGTAYLFAPLSTVLAPVDGEIEVNGQIDSAYVNAQWNEMHRALEGSAVQMASNLSARWAGVYDADHIHIIVDVIDNNFSVDSPTQRWNDDGIEFFFDPSNNSTGNFDNVEDVKVSVFPQLDGTVAIAAATGQFPAAPAGTDFTGLEAAYVKTTLGWRVELRMPLATLRLTDKAEAGWDLGFDISISDDDFGDTRDHILQWSGISALNLNTQQYGTAYLGGNPRLAFISGAVVADATIGLYDSDLDQFVEDKTVYGDWIYHAKLGWLYSGAIAPWDDFLWLYSPVIDAWIATTTGIFPALNVNGDAWVHFATSGGVAWLYDYDTETWMAFE